MIVTGVFKAERGRFARILFERHGQNWLFAIVLLALVSLILGILLDYRIILLAFIVVCLVAPALILLLYYNYGMKGENYLNVLDHRLEIGEEELTVWLRISHNSDDEDNEATDEEVEWRSSVWPLSSFGRYSLGKDYVTFPFLTEGAGFLYLPRDAFGSDEEFREAVKKISSGQRRKKAT